MGIAVPRISAELGGCILVSVGSGNPGHSQTRAFLERRLCRFWSALVGTSGIDPAAHTGDDRHVEPLRGMDDTRTSHAAEKLPIVRQLLHAPRVVSGTGRQSVTCSVPA